MGRLWKKFLSALNQSVVAARHASHGYAELERRFPLLAGKLASIRKGRSKALGSILRSKLALIMCAAVVENYKAGVLALPVTDSLIVPADCDAEECARRISEPLAKIAGIPPMICSSTERFFDASQFLRAQAPRLSVDGDAI